MTAPAMTPARALRKIADAIGRGSLPSSLTVSLNGRSITLKDDWHSHSPEQDLARSDEILRWVDRAFPGGEREQLSSRYNTVKRRRHRQKALFFDQWTYTKRYTGLRISLTYLAPHEHRTYDGFLNLAHPPTGRVWHCNGCRQPLTKTRMAELGLTTNG